MNITHSEVQQMLITAAPGLDSIRVIIEPGPQREDFHTGHFTVVVYGRAWTTYWGAMASPLRDFVAKAPTHYIVARLVQGAEHTNKKKRKLDEEYISRIVDAIKEALRQEGGAA
jgi:hypothetical protein